MKKFLSFLLCFGMLLSLSLAVQAKDPPIVTETADALILNIDNQQVIDKYFTWNSSGCTHEVVDGAWKITFDGTTWWTIPDITRDLHFDMAEYPVYGVRYRVDGLVTPQILFYNFTKESEAAGTHKAEVKFSNLIADGQWHNSVINMDGHPSMEGILEVFRFDVLDASTGTSGTIYIDSVVFAKTTAACNAALGENASENPDLPEAPDPGWSEEEALVRTDELTAFRMGSEYMIKDYFGWDSANCVTSVKDKTWKIDLTNNIGIADLSNKLRVDLDKMPFMAVRYRVENMTSGKIQFYSWTDIRESTGEERLDIDLNCDGAWHVGMLDNRENPYMEDILNLLRIDVNGQSGGTVYIDYIVFASTEAAARAFDEDGEFPSETFRPDTSEPEDTTPQDTTAPDTDKPLDTMQKDSESAEPTQPIETTTPDTTSDDKPAHEQNDTVIIVIVVAVAVILVSLIWVIGLRKKKN